MSKIIKIKDIEIGTGKPKICVPLCESTQQGLWREAEYALCKGAQILEWRIDCFNDPTNKKAVAKTAAALKDACGSAPLLCTFRSKFEGGFFSAEPEEYYTICKNLIDSKIPDMIDIEYFTLPEAAELLQSAQNNGITGIASIHDFKATPRSIELISILHRLEESGADILKLAVTPNTFSDVLMFMETIHSYTEDTSKPPVAAMSMGKLGSISRLSGEHYGSCLTYAAAKNASAPGQVHLETIRAYFDEI